jgi:hypothetical protein
MAASVVLLSVNKQTTKFVSFLSAALHSKEADSTMLVNSRQFNVLLLSSFPQVPVRCDMLSPWEKKVDPKHHQNRRLAKTHFGT